MILEVFSNLYNSVIPSHFTFLIINVLNNEIYTIVYPSNEKSLQSSCSSINSLKGGSIDIFGNLCNKKKVILQCLFMPYCKGMNVVKSTENCNSYLHIYIVQISRLFSAKDSLYQ